MYRHLKGQRVLITGGAGMLGSAIAHAAVKSGAHVAILDAMLPQYGANIFNLAAIRDKIEFIYGDIRDLSLISEAVRGRNLIFNLAAQVSYVDSNQDPFYDLDINCKGHLTVLEACRRHNPQARLIFSSSRFVYGSIEYNPVNESHPYNCLSIYGVHKLNGEKYYQFYHQAHGMETLIFRIANPYGPRQQMKHGKYGIVNWFVRLALDGKPLTIYGDGAQKRDYVYVEDVARALIQGALATQIKHGVYNVGTGTGISFKEMAETVAKIVGRTKIIYMKWPKDRYFVETGNYITDIAKIQNHLGWAPAISLKEGIRRTVRFYRHNRLHYW